MCITYHPTPCPSTTNSWRTSYVGTGRHVHYIPNTCHPIAQSIHHIEVRAYVHLLPQAQRGGVQCATTRCIQYLHILSSSPAIYYYWKHLQNLKNHCYTCRDIVGIHNEVLIKGLPLHSRDPWPCKSLQIPLFQSYVTPPSDP